MTVPETTAPRGMLANATSLATSQLITWSLTLLWTLIVPRFLGPEEMGLLTIATSVTAVLAVGLSILTRDFLVREVVANREQGPRLLTLALLLRLASLPLVYLAALLYGWLAGLDAHAMTVLVIMSAGIFCGVLAEPAVATFQATERMQFIAYSEVTGKSLQTGGAILLVLAGYGVVAIAGLGLAVTMITMLLSLWWAHRIIGLRARPAPAVPVVRKALPYWFVAIFFIAYLWADGLLLGILTPPAVVGWYGAATRLFTTMMFVAVIISTAALPRLVSAHQQHPERLYVAARRPFEWVLILGLPMGVGLASVAGPVVRLLYGAEYTNAVPVLVLLALGLPLMYVNIVSNQLFVASGRPLMMARILAAAALVNVVLNLVLIRLTESIWDNGAIGAAASLTLTELFQAILVVGLVGRRIINRSTATRIAKAATATIGMALVLHLLPVSALPVQITVGVFVFAALAVALRLPSAEERAVAKTVVDRIRTRMRTGGLS